VSAIELVVRLLRAIILEQQHIGIAVPALIGNIHVSPGIECQPLRLLEQGRLQGNGRFQLPLLIQHQQYFIYR